MRRLADGSCVTKTPEFLPDGSGKGEDKEFLMRNQQIIRLYAQAGEKLDISLRHLSHKHKLSLQYALFDQQKNILHNEAVNPGRKPRISVVAPPYRMLYFHRFRRNECGIFRL